MAFFGKLKIPVQVSIKGSQSVISTISHLTQSITNIGSIASGAKDAAVGIVQVADSYVNLDARLTDLLGTSQDAEEMQQALYEASQRTGTSVLTNADAFTRLQLAADQTNLTAEQNVAVLEAINKSMALSGTSAFDAAAAMVQFGQGLASGVLQGDELRSMMERAPGFMRLFAESLGVGIGELKKMGSEGKLTSDVIGRALLDISNNTELMYAEMPATAERGWQRVINAAQKLWDHINDNVGIIDWIQEKLNDAATWIDANEDRLTMWFGELMDNIRTKVPELGSQLSQLMGKMGTYFKEHGDDIINVFTGIINLVSKLITKINELLATDIGQWLQKGEILNLGVAADYYKDLLSGGGSTNTTTNTSTTVNVNGQTSRSDVTNIATESERQSSRS